MNETTCDYCGCPIPKLEDDAESLCDECQEEMNKEDL